jgi:hypothetical protein
MADVGMTQGASYRPHSHIAIACQEKESSRFFNKIFPVANAIRL